MGSGGGWASPLPPGFFFFTSRPCIVTMSSRSLFLVRKSVSVIGCRSVSATVAGYTLACCGGHPASHLLALRFGNCAPGCCFVGLLLSTSSPLPAATLRRFRVAHPSCSELAPLSSSILLLCVTTSVPVVTACVLDDAPPAFAVCAPLEHASLPPLGSVPSLVRFRPPPPTPRLTLFCDAAILAS